MLIENITKEKIVEEQLIEAIWLLFARRTFLSPFTLAMSANEVICGLLKHGGKESCWKHLNDQGEHRKFCKGLWAKLKHADWDPTGIESFHAEIVPMVIWVSINDFVALTGKTENLYFNIFHAWALSSYLGRFDQAFLHILPPERQPFAINFAQMPLEERLHLGAGIFDELLGESLPALIKVIRNSNLP